MKIKGILFDKDGTLIDFFEIWGKALYPVVDGLLEENGWIDVEGLRKTILEGLGVYEDGTIDPEGAFAWMTYDMSASYLAEILEKNGITGVEKDALKEQLIRGFYKESCAQRTEYPVFTDVKEMMERIRNMGILVGIATTDEFQSTKSCMEVLGIDSLISFYGTAEGDMPEKPDGRLIAMAAEKWGIKTCEIAVVGDTPNDMRFAGNGGAVAIGVLSGTGKRKDLEGLSDYVIDSVDDLVPLLYKIDKEC